MQAVEMSWCLFDSNINDRFSITRANPKETYLIIVDIKGSKGPRVPPTSQLATYVSSHGVTPQVLCD